MDRDDDADLGHLPAAVGARLVVDDHDVVDEQHAGAHGQAGTSGEVLGPGDRLRPQLEGVEVDVAEPEHGRPELVAARAALLHDHAVLDQACGRCRAWSTAPGPAGRPAPTGSSAGRPGARSAPGSRGRPTGSRSALLRRVTQFHENSCVLVNHRCSVRITFDNIESRFGQLGRRGTDMLDETNLLQRLGAEAIGTAFLVFIGVGSVPATLIVNGDAPFTMADLGHDLPGVRHHRDRHRLRPRAHRRQPHQPGGHPRAGRLRQVPLDARCRRTSAPRSSARSSAPPPSSACSARRPATSAWASRRTATSAGRRRSPPSSWARSSWSSRSSASSTARPPPGFAGVAIGLVVFAAIIPVAPATGASINPARTVGPMLVQQIAGGDGEVGPAARSTSPPSSSPASLAALLYGLLTRTPADRQPAGAGVDLGDPDAEPRPPPDQHRLTDPHHRTGRDSHEEADQRPERRRGRGPARHRGGPPRPAGRPPQQDHLPR